MVWWYGGGSVGGGDKRDRDQVGSDGAEVAISLELPAERKPKEIFLKN